jgi:hypothetical protein
MLLLLLLAAANGGKTTRIICEHVSGCKMQVVFEYQMSVDITRQRKPLPSSPNAT